jgi:two-component system sensor histidine kinase AgrC
MEYLAIIAAIMLELLCSIVIISGLLRKQGKISFAWAILFVFVATGYILFVPAEWVNGCYLLTLLYVKVGYEISWKEGFITVILSLVVGGLIELFCFFPFVFIFNGRWTDSINNLLAALGSVILCSILVKKLPIWYLKKWCKKKEVWYIAVVIFSLILILTKIIDYNMTLELELADYIYIMVGLILVWLLSFRVMRYRYEERLRKKYFKAFESVIEQIRNRQHKFQNHLDAIYSLHNIYDKYEVLVEEQKKYLQKLTDYEMPAEVMALKNPILIAHVYEKITEAQESGLRMRMKLKCDLEKCEMDEIHMIEILGTLFDNAIQDMKQTGQTEFLVFEVEKEDGIIIRVANPHEELKNQEIRQMFERGYSTKGKNRGIGLHHVKKLVQKYKIELLVENRMIEGRNYICFSVMIGRSTPLV